MLKKEIFLGTAGLLVLGLFLLGIFSSRANTETSSAMIKKAIFNLANTSARNIEATFKIYSPGREQKNDYSVDVRATGVLERSQDNKIAFDGNIDLKSKKSAITLDYAFLLRTLNDGTYLNIKEMPATKEIETALYDKWLIIGNGQQTPIPIDLFDDIFQSSIDQGVIVSIDDSGNEQLSGLKTKKYQIKLNEERLKEILNIKRDDEKIPPLARSVSERTLMILNNFTIKELSVWITSKEKQLGKIFVLLVPKNESLRNSSVTFEININKISGEPPAIETPDDPKRFSETGLLWQLVTLGIK